jgi:hypothetical protein
MSLMLGNVYTIQHNNLYTKELPIPKFSTIEDRALNDTGQITLHIKVKLKKNKIRNNYICPRSLSNILIHVNQNEILNYQNDLSNVINYKSPTGFNPILSDDEDKIYKLDTDFIISGNVILTLISKPLYITFCELYNVEKINEVVDSNFGEFVIQQGNPTFDDSMVVSDTTTILIDKSTKSLMNKTVYIAINIENTTDLLITDYITNIIYSNKEFYICSNNYPYYETPHFSLKNGLHVIVCMISSTEITIYYDDEPIPKIGDYFNYTDQNEIKLSLLNSSLYCINTYDELHNIKKMKYNILVLQNKYNM